MKWFWRTFSALHKPVLIDGKICGNGFDAAYPGNLCIPSKKSLLRERTHVCSGITV
jgi:hypothetical protein